MRCIILAAGEGTRLRPYTENLPKCMVEVDGKSLIERQIEILNSCDIFDIIGIGGYLHDKLEGIFPKLLVNSEYANTNMVETLLCARNELKDGSIISYGDIVYSDTILKALMSSEYDISVVVDDNWLEYWSARFVNVLDDAESLQISDSGFLTDIGAQPSSLNDIQSQYIGLIKVSKAGANILLDLYDKCVEQGTINFKPVKQAYMTDLLQEAINSDISIKAVRSQSLWIEVDSVSDLKNEITSWRLSRLGNE